MTLELQGITKTFPGVVANDDVSLAVGEGEVVALLGENGAGKSTLMNVLYGLYKPDKGTVAIDGEEIELNSSRDAIAAGIGMVHQHFMLVPVFTVAENVILGQEPAGPMGVIKQESAHQIVSEISERYGLRVDPEAVIEDLPVGLQQRVEIIKVLNREARYVIFDEPTAVLTPQEVEEFFKILRGLQEDGKGIIFITHKLGEALEVADRIAVMRAGKKVAEVSPGETNEEALAELMVGRPVELVVPKDASSPGDTVLEVKDVVVLDDRGHRAVNGVSFEVRAGEIVGIAGVQGNGQTELIEGITGLRPTLGGTVMLQGTDVTDYSPRHLHNAGISHIPEDRQESGLVLGFTVAENMVLDSYYEAPFSRGIIMNWGAVEETAERLVEQYDVRTPGVNVPVSNLSGGNQQKVIVAREFDREVALVVASQPTRGIDVGSIEYIHSQIVAKRDAGAAVLVVSSELEEVTALADRVLVLYHGRIAGEFAPDADITDIGLAMLGSAAS
ncbi:MAG TPA: ABC transporter ATP-binding protein [Acidimicrobiia bacterium]|nr:ABC transporter ATP-binding protein [Acidimicrobiia bacterium]